MIAGFFSSHHTEKKLNADYTVLQIELKGFQVYWDLLLTACFYEVRHLKPRWDLLSEILFILSLHQKYIPPEWDNFHPSYPTCLFISSCVTFIVYLLCFCFCFNFQLVKTSLLLKFYKISWTFSCHNCNNTPNLN